MIYWILPALQSIFLIIYDGLHYSQKTFVHRLYIILHIFVITEGNVVIKR